MPSPAHPVRFSPRTVAVAVFLVFHLTACGNGGETSKANAPAGGPAAAAPQAIPVSLLSVQPQNLPLRIEAVAQAEGAREIEVRPRVGGILEKRLFEEGSPVKAGQVLYRIDRAPYEIALTQAKAQLAQQQALAEQANRESNRLKGLLDQQAISRKEYDDSTSTQASSQANLQAAQAAVKNAELNLSYTNVTAPVSGITGRSLRSEGSLVSTADATALTTIAQNNPIWVRFSLPESERAKLPNGQVTPQTISAVDAVLSDGSVIEKGKLNFTASRIDNNLGTVEMRAEFANADQRMLPGQFVTARLSSGVRNGVFLVPQSAVIQTDKGHMVMLMNAEAKVEPRPVQVAEWQGKDWVVTGGLKAGDKVILDNLIKLRPGAPVMDKATLPPPPAPGAANEQKNAGQKAPAKE